MTLDEHLQQRFGLSYLQGQSSGRHAIFLGAFPLVSDDGALQYALVKAIDPKKAFTPPCHTIDPLGHALCATAVSSREALIKELLSTKSIEDRFLLLNQASWSNFHLLLCERSLELLSSTCINNGVNGIENFREDTALASRLKQQAPHLHIPPDSSVSALTIELLQKEATDRLRRIQPGFRINKNYEQAVIHRRSRGEISQTDQLAVQMQLQTSRAIRLAILKSAQAEELEDSKSQLAAEKELTEKDSSPGARGFSSHNPSCELSAMAPRQGLSEAEFNSLRQWSKENWKSNPIAMLLALNIFAFLSDDSFSSARVEHRGCASYLVTPCPFLTKGSNFSSDLHLEVSEEFWRPLPPALAIKAEELFAIRDTEKLFLDRNLFLRDRNTSPSKLNYALRYNAPVWDKTSWLEPEFGLNCVRFDEAGKPKMPGFRSYLVWDPMMNESRIVNHLQSIGWDIQSDPHILKIPRCGSRNCPKPSVLDELLKVLAELLHRASSEFPADYLPAACLLNAIAGITRLMELLLTFARNYPSDAPQIIHSQGESKLLETIVYKREKIRDRALVYTHELRRLLVEVAAVFDQSIQALEERGIQFERDGEPIWDQYSYSFLPRSRTGELVSLYHPRKSLVTAGLLNHPLTERFASLAPNGMRNLEYHLLAPTAEYEREIMDLCDHHPSGGLGPFYKGSAASVTSQHVRAEASRALIRKLINWIW